MPTQRTANPGFLLSMLDKGSFEYRIRRLLDRRKPWTRCRQMAGTMACIAAMGVVCSLTIAMGVRPATALAASTGSPQNAVAPAKVPTFDAVSIRQMDGPPPRSNVWELRPDGYHGHGVPLLALVITAYPPSPGYNDRFTPDELVDAPEWLGRDFYDVDMKVADADLAAWKQPAVQRAMLRAVLADRLKFAAHYDRKLGQAYELQLAKGGERFKTTTSPALTAIQQADPHADAAPNGSISARGKSGEVMMYNAPIEQLCRDLRHMAGHPILDKTGLTGRYDMTFHLDPPGGWPQPHDLSDTPFFVVEQLGLKLVSVKAPAEILVIDHAELPTAN